MKHRIVTTAVMLSLSVFAVQPLCAAPLAAAAHSETSKPVKVKTINFHLRNDSQSPLTIQAGDQQMTIAPGKSAMLKLQEGTQVTTVNATAHVAAGAVLTMVTAQLDGNTLAVS